MLCGCVSWTECYITTILVPYWNAHHTRSQHRPPAIWTHFCNLTDRDSTFLLKNSRETVTIISQICCYVSSTDLGSDRQNSSLAQCNQQNSHGGQSVGTCKCCCHARATNVKYSACVSGLSYPACKLHAPYYIIICDLSCSTTFFTLFHNTIFWKTLLNIKRVFWLSLQPLSETSLILRRFWWDIITNVHMSSHTVPIIVRF